ncbi:ribosomal-protein-S18p-alanine acetyltransferase [Gracilibacillus boraciitolerans JCM 21714]|uniref:[Ribosomal protein bS18]-alanine N-acetyltransferase n=1 Tax=Gracilibacillus boraciitolerans JCM 21714 TaxID=1298598 RepID=W4VQE8_9BACI|nr:ribosomal protein S18-alanine N-acetyltransferase [Gracilibacillus boraciitolerans]GAE95442.1 ribosomal-protein-S18p-alanine acetyltransferase [Gracilibacillus boraciitolerans JCM 21714]
MTKVEFRKMTESDITSVMNIDELSFPIPWPEDIYYEELRNNKYAVYFVAVVDDKVVGFCGSWMILDEAQITNIAIDPIYRGRGYGQALFQYVINYGLAHGIKHLSLEVRVSNTAALRMYKKFGLQPGGIRKSYYTDNLEDALVLWVKL